MQMELQDERGGAVLSTVCIRTKFWYKMCVGVTRNIDSDVHSLACKPVIKLCTRPYLCNVERRIIPPTHLIN